mmetsp:Transcript_716/g.1578  ORF Transcript_716/g.1578 Transcript_716/m.1578 type:complete len:200 (-) Transcript_716:569-1168(-)
MLSPYFTTTHYSALGIFEGHVGPKLLLEFLEKLGWIPHRHFVTQDSRDIGFPWCRPNNLIVEVPHDSGDITCINVLEWMQHVTLGLVHVEGRRLYLIRCLAPRAVLIIHAVRHQWRGTNARASLGNTSTGLRTTPRHLSVDVVLKISTNGGGSQFRVPLRMLLNTGLHGPLHLFPAALLWAGSVTPVIKQDQRRLACDV